jgi:hypothetical protein
MASQRSDKAPPSSCANRGSRFICAMRRSVSPGSAALTATDHTENSISISRLEFLAGLSAPIVNHESPSARNRY